MLQKYEVLTCGDVQKFIRKQTSANETPKYFVPLENMFDIIKHAHTATGHGGRDWSKPCPSIFHIIAIELK